MPINPPPGFMPEAPAATGAVVMAPPPGFVPEAPKVAQPQKPDFTTWGIPTGWEEHVIPVDKQGNPAAPDKSNQFSVKRIDGGVWFGPEQGNPDPKGGWYDAQGHKLQAQPVIDLSATRKPQTGFLKPDGSVGYVPTPGYAPQQGKPADPGVVARFAQPNMQSYGMNAPGAAQVTPEASQLVGTEVTAPLQQAARIYSHVAPDALGGKAAGDLVNRIQQNKQDIIASDPSGLAAKLSQVSDIGTQGFLAGAIGLPGAVERMAAPYLVRGAGYIPTVSRAIQTGVAGGTAYGALHAATNPEGVDTSSTAFGDLPQYVLKGAGNTLAESADTAAAGGLLNGALSAVVGGPSAISEFLRRPLGTPLQRQAALARAQEIRASTASAQYPQGAEPSLSEVTQSPNLQKIENATEYLPGSGRGPQLRQNNAALGAAVKEQATSRAPALGTTGVAGDEISASAERQLAAKRAEYGPAYDQVRATVGDTPPVVDNTIKAYDAAILEESGISGPESPQVKALTAERDNFIHGKVARNYSELEKIQDRNQSIAAKGSDVADQAQRDIAGYKGKIARANGLDMEATMDRADPTGKTSQLYRDTNKAYAQEVHPLNPDQPADREGYRKEARILNGKDPSKIGPAILDQDNPDMATYVKKALDPKGHDAVRAEIWKRIDDASSVIAEGGKSKGKVFSPAKAATEIDNHANFIKEFFTQAEQDRISGLRNALKAMERSGQFMESLNNGKFLPAMTGMGELALSVPEALAGSPGKLATVVGTTLASRLYNTLSGTAAGKAWMLKAGTVPSNSPLMKSLMGELPKVLAARTAPNVVPFNPTVPAAASTGKPDQLAQQ